MPSHFIEVTSKENKKELLHTGIIERVHVVKGKTHLKFRTDNALAATGMEIKEDYEAVKRQLLGQK
jgi:hypothetical protein